MRVTKLCKRSSISLFAFTR